MKNNLFVLLSCVMLFAVSLQYCCAKDGVCVEVKKGTNPNDAKCTTTVYHAKCAKAFGKYPNATDQ